MPPEIYFIVLNSLKDYFPLIYRGKTPFSFSSTELEDKEDSKKLVL